jgi:transglutaminase-like putative cysteine protease
MRNVLSADAAPVPWLPRPIRPIVGERVGPSPADLGGDQVFRHGQSGIAGLTLLSLLIVAGPGPAAIVHAQTPTSFAIPTAAELPAAAAATVLDTPAVLPDTIDLTPIIAAASAAVDALPAEDWDVAELAKTLPDTDAAFALVRDSIRFDGYPGVLRGAGGTLSARAGNALDRASLLKALLDVHGATTRFAFGTIDGDTAAALADHVLDEPTRPMPAPAVLPFDAAFEQAIDIRAGRDLALLSGALGDRLARVAADGTDAALTDLASHAWVQLQGPDGTWLDLDPSMPDATAGEALTTADATGEVMPADRIQTVTVRVIAENLVEGTLEEATVLEAALPAWEAADQQVLLTFLPGTGDGGLLNPGGLFGGGGGLGATYDPVLLIDETAWHGDPIGITGETEGGGMLGGGGARFDLASLALEIETTVPGWQPTIDRHLIADRVPAGLRVSGDPTPEDLTPVADIDGTPATFATVLHLMLSTGGSDPRGYAIDQGFAAQVAAWGANVPDTSDVLLDRALAPAAASDQALVIASEQRLIPAVDDEQVRAYVASPRIYLASRSIDPADPTRDIVLTDLMRDEIRTLTHPGAPTDAAARHQLWYGALQAALETEYMLSIASTLQPEGLTLQGVSFDMAQPLIVLDAAATVLPGAADEVLASTLAAGGLAIVPGDVSSASTWWQVGPDGTTRSIIAPRMGASGSIGKKLSPAFRVQPKQPSQPGGNGKGGRGGNEYQNSLEPSKQATPVAQAAGNVTRDTFQQNAGTIARNWKKFSGG